MDWYAAVSIAVTEEQLQLVRRILARVLPEATYLAFGSRLYDYYHPSSDLNIAVKAVDEISLIQLSALEEAFAESDLPFRVGVVDLHRASPEFQRLVEAHHLRI